MNKILGPDVVEEVATVPLSDNTNTRHIDDMSADIEIVVFKKICISGKFAMQLYESTDFVDMLTLSEYKQKERLNCHIYTVCEPIKKG